MTTGFERIAMKAQTDRKCQFSSLMHHINQERVWMNLKSIRANSSSGIDGKDLKTAQSEFPNWYSEISPKLHNQGYRAPPVRRVHIPKPGKTEKRPLGIPTILDRALQKSVAEVLNQVYEQDFLACSFGGRAGKSAHQAIESLRGAMATRKLQYVYEADLKNFFGSLSHNWMMRFLRHRVRDPRILSIIRKWLKAGTMEDGKLTIVEKGTPQGGPISVLLSNCYLHYVLDLWIEKVVRPRMKGEVHYVRYLDDFVLCFQYKADADKFSRVITKRLKKFDLELEPSKTSLLRFGRFAQRDAKLYGEKLKTFSFLGFTFYCSRRLTGKFRVGVRTEKSRLNRGIMKIKSDMRSRRHLSLKEQIRWINIFLRGHYGYYGISGNSLCLIKIYRFVFRYWHKVLSTRSQNGRLSFKKYARIVTYFPILRPRIMHPRV